VDAGRALGAATGDTTAASTPVARVLCFSPYNYWDLHGMWEITVLHSLRLRGAEVEHVLCDGLFSDCDVFWKATNPRHPNACLECMNRVVHLSALMGSPFTWLGRCISFEEVDGVAAWARSLTSAELQAARLRDWELGEWVKSSVHSHFRRSRLDFGDAEVCDAYRSHVFSAGIAAVALEHLLERVRPDVMFLFSGRMGSTRVALELALARGIRVICHERGLLRESLKLFRNDHSLALAPIRALWDEWGDVPLLDEELGAVQSYLDQRAHGKNIGEVAFSSPPEDAAALRSRLGIAPEQTVWLLLTSSEDEVIANKERSGAFSAQLEWIRATVDYVRQHPELQLVIRVHPNIASDRSIGKNLVQLEEMRNLAQQAPANVHVVMPDDVASTYTLMEIAALGLVYISITGLEMACRGKQVIVAAGAWIRDLPFAATIHSQDEYAPMLDARRGLCRSDRSIAVQRLAYRFAYALYFRWNIPFPLVEMPDAHNGRLRYRALSDLAPGVDPGLDRVCQVILEDVPICAPPSARERGRDEQKELAWFEAHCARS